MKLTAICFPNEGFCWDNLQDQGLSPAYSKAVDSSSRTRNGWRTTQRYTIPKCPHHGMTQPRNFS
ncbi:rCG45209 [Rattus norvegicus]|uniref:RCG45209 n=1 Tax=Rattus norvegicus TaxID=10116 RepID=A6KLI7_RAT|nr:rCG45209 [Rattus norvegicus]